MRVKRLLVLLILLLISLAASGTIQHKTPVDSDCPSGEWFCYDKAVYSEDGSHIIYYAPYCECVE